MNQGDRLAVILFGLNKKFGAELVFNSRHVNTADDAASMAASSPYPSMVAYNSVSKMEKFDNWKLLNEHCSNAYIRTVLGSFTRK